MDLVRRAVPLALGPENDPRKEEFKQLQEKKEQIDKLAHKQVRRILWSGLGFFMCQVGLFFRLTFWEFSWDVMEPIAFFTTASGLLVGYAYFLITSRDPTYQDFMERLFLSRQRKLCAGQKFDMERYLELQKHCRCPLEGHHPHGPKLHGLWQPRNYSFSSVTWCFTVYSLGCRTDTITYPPSETVVRDSNLVLIECLDHILKVTL